MHGVVATFDEHRGYGTIRAADGAEVFFHCTRILDGSRTVDVGATVAYRLVPGHHGRLEAAAITKP
jgi:cold shock CspA family protein